MSKQTDELQEILDMISYGSDAALHIPEGKYRDKIVKRYDNLNWEGGDPFRELILEYVRQSNKQLLEGLLGGAIFVPPYYTHTENPRYTTAPKLSGEIKAVPVSIIKEKMEELLK